ncbi:WGR domain-containing protein (plasmid) [Pseudomonas sp. FeN3W]|nr:WGR domain-containing protein [Pseudomonas sp. FeN3W]
MSALVRSEMLVKTNVDDNNNKFWKVEQFDNHTVQVTNGRVGSNGQLQPLKSFASEIQASRFLQSKMNSKLRDGYQLFKGIQTDAGKSSMSRMALEMAASEQIRTKDLDVVSDLVKRLVKANVHSILSSTDLKYDEDTGLFQTPLGIVTLESLSEARQLLTELGKSIEKGDFDSAPVKTNLASYLMLIPQKVGRKLAVRDVLPDMEAIQKQNSLLDDLEASVGQVEELQKNKVEEKAVEVPQIFNCEINVLRDKKVLKWIDEFFASTASTRHASFGYKIKCVYEVTIDEMQKAYDSEGKKLGNVMRLWHGTRPGNILSILKSGLIIPRSNAPHVCGRMFGDGLYCSDQSTKSLNYATGWWAGAKENQCFMFLADVAMGKVHVPRGPSQNLPAPGTDSTFAKANISSVMNNEMIVYKTNQATVRYLVEFEM